MPMAASIFRSSKMEILICIKTLPEIIDLKGLFSGWGKYFKFSIPVHGILFSNKKGEIKSDLPNQGTV